MRHETYSSGEQGFTCNVFFLFSGEHSQDPCYILCYVIESDVT